jgi:DNA-binding response OmpR family regulator
MSKHISVLVIDDEKHIRDLFACHPALDSFEVTLATDGRKGIDLARRYRPDVILLDWMLPDMDGMEVFAELKKDPGTANTPIFMLTAKKEPADVGRAICEGVDGYFAKPFDVANLARTLKQKLANPATI